MHRFRKKQDLKKQFSVEHNNNLSTANESQVSISSTVSELPSLPPTSDFRTSLILPSLSKRFSVLRRGEKAQGNNVTSTTKNFQESPLEIYNSRTFPRSLINSSSINEVSKTKLGQSPLSNLTKKPNDEELISENSSFTMSSNTPPTSINISLVNDDNNNNHEEVPSNPRKSNDLSGISGVNNINNNENVNENEENVSNKEDKIESPVKSLRISSNGLLVNPTKDRPKPPRTRPPSILHVSHGYSWQNEFTTLSKNNIASSSQLSLPNFVQSSPPQLELSPRATSFNNDEEDLFLQPSSPRSPLDKLSEGLYNLKLQSSLTGSQSQNLSQTSLRSLGGSSVNEVEEIEQPIKKSPSINSLRNIRNIEDENVYDPDRTSTTSTIGSSLKRIRTIKTTNSNTSSNSNYDNNNNNGSIDIDNEGDDEAEYGNNRNSNATGIVYLKNSSSTNNHSEKNHSEIQPESSTSDKTNITGMSNNTTGLQKKPSRGGTVPPPKPQPPPLSLTDTLIASGQPDIAHQVMVMRRAQNMNQQQLQPQYQFNTKQRPSRKWSKKNVKNISGPQLVSASSSVKTIPIVQLGQTDDDEFRRKRESETGIGKSLRRIRNAFTSDSESALFGKKRMSFGSYNSYNENLSRKFVSDENLNQRFINNERRGNDFVKRRAFSTRENDKPNDKLKQDIRNNLTFIMNNEQQQFNGDDTSDRSSTSNSNGKWTGQPPLYDIYALKRHAEMITRYSSNKKIDNPITSSRPPSSQSSLSLTVDIPNESESVPSSPISPFSDYPSSTSTPPPISPRNPLRQPDKARIKYSTGSQNSTSDAGSDDKRDSKDSKSSSRLMSIFNNYSNRSSKSSSRNSKSSDINHLQVPQTSQTNNNIADDGLKSNNKVIRRTIIITKPYLPPLPEDSTPSTPVLPSSANSSSSFISSKSVLKKKKVHLDDGKIHVASDGRQWFLSKKSPNDDEKDEESENTGDSTLLSIPIPKTPLTDRPPTPIPSPSTRGKLDLPFGIPIPPIPSPHRNSVASKTSKRTSKSSIASSLKSSSSKFNRKSKSIHSTYSESIYDYYNYSDKEGADDEDDSNSTNTNDTTKRQQLETQDHVEVLEMSDGSYTVKVLNGLREDVEDRNYYCANFEDYSKIWPRDFGRSNYGCDLEDDQLSQLSFSDQQQNNNVAELSHFDSYNADFSNSQLSGVEFSSKQKHGQYLTPDVLLPPPSPNKLIDGEHNNSTVSITSNGEEKFIPSTSIYIAKDVTLPKLLEEMSKGLGNVDLDREEIQYVYGGEVGASGTGVVGGMTVEEKLDQVMRALGVDDKVYIE